MLVFHDHRGLCSGADASPLRSKLLNKYDLDANAANPMRPQELKI